MSLKGIVGLVMAGAVILMLVVGAGNLFEYVDSDEYVIFQSLQGNLSCALTAGPYWQGFGKVEHYQKRTQLWFSDKKDQGKDADESLQVRFNDKAKAAISGSIAWEMPSDCLSISTLYQKYGKQTNIEHQLIRTVMEKGIFMTGPLMSSTESAAERRNELLQLLEDQIHNGIVLTKTVQESLPDPITGEKKMTNVVKLAIDNRGQIIRAEPSPLGQFGIKTYNLTINAVKYDDGVEKQIQAQQQATMQVQLSIAKAREAEQDTITVAKRGEAEAARAKWETEKINSQLVATAEGRKRAEQENMKAAEYYKTAQLLKAEGDAGYRAKIMQADGALEKRLNAYLEAQKVWAAAVQGYQGAWVPSIVSGGGNSASGNGATTLIDLLSAKTARDLGLDFNLGSKQK